MPFIFWSLIWKGISLWRSAKKNQLNWFIAILLFNTGGLLPLLYLLFFQSNSKVETTPIKPVKKVRRRRKTTKKKVVKKTKSQSK